MIFVINPGSTSTKLAIFENNQALWTHAVHHPAQRETAPFADRLAARLPLVREALAGSGLDTGCLRAIAARGGLLRPLASGTYRIDAAMLDDLQRERYGRHDCNLGAPIGAALADELGIPAYIVDPPTVDELSPEARWYGWPDMVRQTRFHALNQKAVVRRAARERGLNVSDSNWIVAHLGGGITIGAHRLGRVIEVNNALEEGPFTPDRAGALPTAQLVELCFSGRWTKAEIHHRLVGSGGLVAFFGTNSLLLLEQEMAQNPRIGEAIDALGYAVAKSIGACAAALAGEVDGVVVTGGLARCAPLVEAIRTRVVFLGPFFLYPGEDELIALSEGVQRILDGLEEASVYEAGGRDEKSG